MPAFRSLHPAADQNLLRTAAQLVDQQSLLEDAAGALLIEDGSALDAHAAAAAPPELARAAIRRLAGAPSPPAGCLERALELCHRRAGTRRVPLGAGRVAERRYGVVRVHRRRSCARTARVGARSASPDARPSDRSPSAAGPSPRGSIPALAEGARVRAARPGEHLDGRRATIARMLLEARVPQPLRSVYPVIEVDGRLVCVPGVAIAADASARPGLELAVESA